MKMKFLIITLLTLVALSCTKETTSSFNLTGKWDWVSSSGGIAGITYTPKSTGVRKVVEFTNDSVFRYYQKDTLTFETRYHILKSKSIYSQDSTFLITFDNHSLRQSYILKNDTLILNDECYDCFENVYVRIR
jgi:hypothetical protein